MLPVFSRSFLCVYFRLLRLWRSQSTCTDSVRALFYCLFHFEIYYSGVFCWKIQRFQINFAAQCSYYCIIHLNMNNANVVVCSLYTYMSMQLFCLLLLFIYLAFLGNFSFWMPLVCTAHTILRLHGCLRKIIKKRMSTQTNCTRCRLLHSHASWPCKMPHHTTPLNVHTHNFSFSRSPALSFLHFDSRDHMLVWRQKFDCGHPWSRHCFPASRN